MISLSVIQSTNSISSLVSSQNTDKLISVILKV